MLGVGLGTGRLKLLSVTSGSMEPELEAGDLLLARSVPVEELRPGDIVTVPVGDGLLTHRVEETTRIPDGTWEVVLRGDANQGPDSPVRVDSHVLKTVWVVGPYARAHEAATTPPVPALAAATVVCLAMSLLALGRSRAAERGEEPETQPLPIQPGRAG